MDMLETADTRNQPVSGNYDLESELAPCWKEFECRMQERLHLVKNQNLCHSVVSKSASLPEQGAQRI